MADARSRTRFVVMVIIGAVTAAVTIVLGAAPYAPLVGWDAAAVVFTLWVWLSIAQMDSARTATHAVREDPGRAGTDLLVIIAAVASLASVGVVLVQAGSEKGATQDLLAGLGVASVALTWFAVHSLFTLRYARLYYTRPMGGVDFNQDERPRYVDFAYLAFTIGMTFQVSDTDLRTPAIRASALRHALLSYLFGAVILASTINLVAGLAGSSG
jgi:uncharacterized membrane protein